MKVVIMYLSYNYSMVILALQCTNVWNDIFYHITLNIIFDEF